MTDVLHNGITAKEAKKTTSVNTTPVNTQPKADLEYYYNGIIEYMPELVDITTQYPWTKDKIGIYNNQTYYDQDTNKSNYIALDIPYCYAIEYQQRYGITITNFLNTLYNSVNFIVDEAADEAIDGLQTLIDSIKNVVNPSQPSNTTVQTNTNTQGASTTQTTGEEGKNEEQDAKIEFPTNIKDSFNKAKSKITGFKDFIKDKANNKYINLDYTKENPTNNSSFLEPYNMMYALKTTKKRYCFPMLTKNSSGWDLKNQFGDTAVEGGIFNKPNLLNLIADYAAGTANYIRDINDILLFMNGTNGTATNSKYYLTGIEKAKYFNFPSGTNSYQINFPLYNTIRFKEDEEPLWKQNYKFITLFALRNMIFRKDAISYYPPLFYDLHIPGKTREPICYVSEFSATPMGMSRILKLNTSYFKNHSADNINTGLFDKETDIAVSVPEMWMVSITFTSLLAPSANLALSGMNDTTITANTVRTGGIQR